MTIDSASAVQLGYQRETGRERPGEIRMDSIGRTRESGVGRSEIDLFGLFPFLSIPYRRVKLRLPRGGAARGRQSF
jgi:hypothetical protein